MNLCYDMDGTLADLYNYPRWLESLRNSIVVPYIYADLTCDQEQLIADWKRLKSAGHKIIIISWLSKESTPEYEEQVRLAKIEWLKNHNLLQLIDGIFLVPYGTPKHRLGIEGILFDDNSYIRELWEKASSNNAAYSEKEIFKIHGEMLDKDLTK